MEILIALLVGLLAGGFITYCCLTTARDPIELNPNDFTLPEILPMLEPHKMNRGFSVDGNKIHQTWEHKEVQQYRTITVNSKSYTQEDFLKFWYENELNFYLKNKALFDAKGKNQ